MQKMIILRPIILLLLCGLITACSQVGGEAFPGAEAQSSVSSQNIRPLNLMDF